MAGTGWRQMGAVVLWVMLLCAVLAPLLGLALTALAMELSTLQPGEPGAPFRAMERHASVVAALPYLYVLALIFIGPPAAACGGVLGLVLAAAARRGWAAPHWRVLAGGGVALGFAVVAGWLPDEVGMPIPMWTLAVATGALCGLAVRRGWLARRLMLPGAA